MKLVSLGPETALLFGVNFLPLIRGSLDHTCHKADGTECLVASRGEQRTFFVRTIVFGHDFTETCNCERKKRLWHKD